MRKRQLLDAPRLEITLLRLCHQLLESHGDFSESVLLGLQPRGVLPAQRLHQRLESLTGRSIPLGWLDVTFFRDDFRRKAEPLRPNATHVPFLLEDKRVILVDDVLFTGRSVRAGLDAMTAFGRPRSVELLVLIDRKFNREVPVEAQYIGLPVDTVTSEHVFVEWATDPAQDAIWLISDKD